MNEHIPSHEGGYQPAVIEAKWHQRWETRGTNYPDLDHAVRPFYNLMMFPYPSAEGLHVGNFFAFTGADVFGRFQRLRGYQVFEPIGFDAFGIHSENFAIKTGTHPAVLIPRNIDNFRKQLRQLGGMFDWRHEVATTDPEYYRWTQWLFLKLLKAGAAYRKEAAVNWCPACKTVLANEQVEGGACERCGTNVAPRVLTQWFFRITDYADRLLAHLDDKSLMDWSDTTVAAQRNWLGKSTGAEIEFHCAAAPIRVFTTRPDTLMGATFLVLAPEHPAVELLTSDQAREEVSRYRQAVMSRDLVSRKVGDREKTGVFTGGYVRHPITGNPIPVWIADYVLMEYGTGAVMAVPAHDQRDFEFASRFRLPITQVIAPAGEPGISTLAEALTQTAGCVLVNSGDFDGLTTEAGAQAIVEWLESRGVGRRRTQFRLYDWCISRQRYWGPPIPVIHCESCGIVPVPEEELPVRLPVLEDFRPDDSGISPLARDADWYNVPCPACGTMARRETDVSDTFLDSAWYYLRYTSTDFHDRPFDAERVKRWCPVTSYIGGNEHAVLHLLYSRYLAMVLHDQGLLEFEEPFAKFRAHGMIIKDGNKMSKSRGNVVVPDQYIATWGADTFRIYLMFLGPFQEGGDFRDAGIAGPRRFLDKVWDLVGQTESATLVGQEIHRSVLIKWHQTRKKVTEAIEALSYNTAIAALMEFLNALRDVNCSERQVVKDLIIMIAPFAPHFAEECWERLGHQTSVFDAAWPTWDESLTVDTTVAIAVQVNGKTRGTITVARDSRESEVIAAALTLPAAARAMDGKEIRKRIVVPNRLVNLVVG